MRLTVLAALFLAQPALGQTLPMTDAFGIALTDDAARAGWSGYRETMSGASEVVAPGPADRVQIYLGAKSLVAGRETGLALALVSDALGNLVADGTEVTFAIAAERHQGRTRNGMATQQIGPFDQAGAYHAGAGTQGQQSGQIDFVVTADLTGVTPQIQPLTAPAPVEDFTEITTTALTDRFGNPVAGGTGLTLLVAGADGSTTLLPAVVVGGIGRARLLARDMDPDGRMQANLAATTSPPQPLTLASLTALAPLTITARALPQIAATRLDLGPFLTTSGHVLNDGARVEVQITTAHKPFPAQSGWVLDGMVHFTLLAGASDFPLSLSVTSPLGTVDRVIPHQEVAP